MRERLKVDYKWPNLLTTLHKQIFRLTTFNSSFSFSKLFLYSSLLNSLILTCQNLLIK